MSPSAKSVSIIVLCHNRWAVARRCLESLRRSTDPRLYELLVYDNASTDGTASGLRKLAAVWPELRVFRNARNLSFSAGINRGMREARGLHIVWLNNDTVLAPGWLEGLLKAARPLDVGAVGPMTDHMAPLQQVSKPFRTRKAGSVEDAPFLGGFCFLVKASAALSVGFLDERFVWGWEDMDYCMRLRQNGERLVLARDVFVRHDGSATFKTMDVGVRRRLDFRNRRLMLRKWVRAEPWRSDFLNLYVRMPSYWKEKLPFHEMKSLVSIVVHGRGKWADLHRTLESVRRCAGNSAYEVLASCSDLKTVPRLKTMAQGWPQLRVLGSWGASRIASALNLSAREALGDQLLFLSDGVLATPGWVEHLLSTAKSEKNVGGAAPLCAGADLEWQRTRADGGARAVPYVRGLCLLISRQTFARVGEFDDRFKKDLWAEDYCHRAVQRGYRILVSGAARVRRPGGSSVANATPHDLKMLFHKWSSQPLLPEG